MIAAPEAFAAGPLHARRIAPGDLPFVTALMARAEMNAHKPDPSPVTAAQAALIHGRDLDHWAQHGVGRYVVRREGEPIGLCGLTTRAGFDGLNLSYHLSPDHWGRGYATTLVRALVEMAKAHLTDHGEIFALARPANPGSIRVLEKCGFSLVDTREHGGAPTGHYRRRLDG